MPQQDFNAAERQAIMRAREMYSRAMPVQNADPVFHKQPNQPPTAHSAHQNINYQPPLPPRQEQQNPRQGSNPFSRSASPFSMFFDGDMKLIIAMMLLLSGDGGDTLLLMALIYIML